jgi:hypothetical protein
MDIIENSNFVGTNPSIGARRPTREGFKVDSDGTPLDIIAKQKANDNVGSDDITNDPMFAQLFGHAGKKVKDPFSQGGNEDHWFSGTPTPIKKESETKSEKKVEEPNTITPSEDPNDITNDPKLQNMLKNMNSGSEASTNESEKNISDSHTM